MSSNFKAILLAADGCGSKDILGINKCFLEIQKIPSFVRVLYSLNEVKLIDEIWIVGPESHIKNALILHAKNVLVFNKIVVVAQGLTILDNLRKALNGIFLKYKKKDQYVLIVPGDIPLIASEEIIEFILKSTREKSDYSIGIVSKDTMQVYIENNRKTEEILFFPFKEDCYRINNLHLVKPLKIRNVELIEKLYLLRHNKRFINILLIIRELIAKGYFNALYFYALIQFSMFFNSIGFPWVHDRLKGLVSIKKIEKIVSSILGAKVLAVETFYQGAAMDIDCEEDYLAINEGFAKWIKYKKLTSIFI